jgi:hypothetical protein
MATATRDDTGQWNVVAEEGDHPNYVTWLGRFFNSVDPIFRDAKSRCEFDFILCLLRIHGMEEGGWDPYETTLRAIPKIRDLLTGADAETRKHIALWLYGHIMEASEPYERLANFILVAQGQRGARRNGIPATG